jgi:hypothetical protein
VEGFEGFFGMPVGIAPFINVFDVEPGFRSFACRA